MVFQVKVSGSRGSVWLMHSRGQIWEIGQQISDRDLFHNVEVVIQEGIVEQFVDVSVMWIKGWIQE